MNKIVREHYPVSKLPDDLKVGLNPFGTVTLELREDDARESRRALIEAAQRRVRGAGVTTEEAVQRVRELRDEWDD